MSGLFEHRNALLGLLPDETPPRSALADALDALAGTQPPPAPSNALADALLAFSTSAAPSNSLLASYLRPAPVNHLAPSGGASSALMPSLLSEFAEAYRRRREWNDRFEHWERAESGTEAVQIQRARSVVRDVLAQNQWLRAHGVQIIDQGSYTNRTNTRNDADIDIRVQSPHLQIDYGPGLDVQRFRSEAGYSYTGMSFQAVLQKMRFEIVSDLNRAFGTSAVDAAGSKAIRVNGVTGSRGDVDVVPVFTLHHYWGSSILTGNLKHNGTALLTTDGRWIYNYPDQHLANGRAKRAATEHQFKKIVRIVKRLRVDMIGRGLISEKPPSFLIECLVYLVEDTYFTHASDDRYDRVKCVLTRLNEKLHSDGVWCSLEINGVKPLFAASQPWSLADARAFVGAVLLHLGRA